MKKNKNYKIIALLSIFAIMLGACGSAKEAPNSEVATAVALTVAAQNVQENPTSTAIPTATVPANITFPTPTEFLFPTPTKSVSSSTADAACARANLVSETIPDGTIMKPGATFTKVWQIKNSSSCVWDTNYKIIFWDGDLLGGAYLYNLPQSVAPDGVVDIPLVLIAPANEGTFTSKWVLQTPKGSTFGVGQYSDPFYAKIVVSNAAAPAYAITSVTYDVVRDPDRGCATTVRYTINATVTSNGPIKIKYGFNQSDGTTQWKDRIEFKTAGSQTVSDHWNFHLGSTPGNKWVQFVILTPYSQEFDKQYFSYLCGNTP